MASAPIPQHSSMPTRNGLTVVIPTYNHGHLISDALDSVVRQTRLPETVIVFDDASTDDTETIVRAYQELHRFIRLVRLPVNQGVVKLLNKGLALADTEFVTFLAAEDRKSTRLNSSH